jgi:hypothetical protein
MARAARSLNVLLEQLNNHAPHRDKKSDGGIGDPAHAARLSDHNPVNNVFYARDYTHDPEGGLDCHWLAEMLRRFRDPRIKYVIWNERIWNPAISQSWRPATGHTEHLHLSVNRGNGDQAQPWQFYLAHINPTPEEDMSVIFAKGPDAPLVCKVEFNTGESGVIAYRTTIPNPNEPGYKLWLHSGHEVIVTETQADFDNIPYKPGTPGAKK